ncbi:MAG: hypothetical protein ACXW5U_05495 [Thermoanaerobaculia bacterium]
MPLTALLVDGHGTERAALALAEVVAVKLTVVMLVFTPLEAVSWKV